MSDQAIAKDPFLGQLIEICIVTRSHRQTIEGLLMLGIGPWKSYTFSPSNTSSQTYRGVPSAFTLKVCFASEPNSNLVWEIIEPISGPTIFQEFLDKRGDGIHHVAYDCNGVPFEERIAEFKKRGFELVQEGRWMGGKGNRFAFFETDGSTGTCFETYEFPHDWVFPEPDEVFPLAK